MLIYQSIDNNNSATLDIFQFIHFIKRAQKSIFKIDQCVRNQRASFSKRIPSVLLISIIEFLTVYGIIECDMGLHIMAQDLEISMYKSIHVSVIDLYRYI